MGCARRNEAVLSRRPSAAVASSVEVHDALAAVALAAEAAAVEQSTTSTRSMACSS